MESKPANTFTGAAKLLPQQLVLPDAAEALKRAKIERFLQGTATFEQEQGKQPQLLRLSSQTHFHLQRPRPMPPRQLHTSIFQPEDNQCAHMNSLWVLAISQVP